MTAVRVPAGAENETSFSTALSPSVTTTSRSAMSPRRVGVQRRRRAFASGASSTPAMRAYDALACAITLLMKPIMMTGKIRMAR